MNAKAIAIVRDMVSIVVCFNSFQRCHKREEVPRSIEMTWNKFHKHWSLKSLALLASPSLFPPWETLWRTSRYCSSYVKLPSIPIKSHHRLHTKPYQRYKGTKLSLKTTNLNYQKTTPPKKTKTLRNKQTYPYFWSLNYPKLSFRSEKFHRGIYCNIP